MEFDWNEAKRLSNMSKHKLDFVDAVACFADPDRLVWDDVRMDYGERRINMLARHSGRLFHITYTLRGSITWMISARKANDREKKRYEENRYRESRPD